VKGKGGGGLSEPMYKEEGREKREACQICVLFPVKLGEGKNIKEERVLRIFNREKKKKKKKKRSEN